MMPTGRATAINRANVRARKVNPPAERTSMATLLLTDKAPLLDQDGVHIGTVGQTTHTVASSDPAVASIDWPNWQPFVVAQSVGITTVTAVRLADGAEATLEVEVVTAAALPPFSISLGTPLPK